jgi:hypothetical protein
MNVYLDTNLWSGLLQQPADDEGILSALEAKGVRLVIGDSDLCELLQSYPFDGKGSSQRAIEMFSRMRRYAAMPNSILRDNMALLAAEMHATKDGKETIDPFISEQDHDTYRELIGCVREGIVSQQDRDHLAWRAMRVTANRTGQTRHMQGSPGIKARLKSVPRESLGDWLEQEALGHDGIVCLASDIYNYFNHPAAVDKPTMADSYEWAQNLLQSLHWRMPRAIVRRNLYMNWRSARSYNSSIPPDLLIDTDHVLNSIYCDVYATEESRQEDYARLLLTNATGVRIYNRATSTSVADWLLSLAV